MVIETLKVSSMTKSVITVDTATDRASRIAQHLAKHAINVVERTNLELCVSPVIEDLSLSQSMTQGGQMGQIEKIDARTDVKCMKLKSVTMTIQWMIWQIKSSQCFYA